MYCAAPRSQPAASSTTQARKCTAVAQNNRQRRRVLSCHLRHTYAPAAVSNEFYRRSLRTNIPTRTHSTWHLESACAQFTFSREENPARLATVARSSASHEHTARSQKSLIALPVCVHFAHHLPFRCREEKTAALMTARFSGALLFCALYYAPIRRTLHLYVIACSARSPDENNTFVLYVAVR